MERLEALYNAPKDKPLDELDVKWLMKMLPRNQFSIKYVIYKKQSHFDTYLGIMQDSMNSCPRRSGVENHWETIESRSLTNTEWKEVCQNYGSSNRRFTLWQYKAIEDLIIEEKKYNVKVPQKFIDKAKELGYTKAKKDPQVRMQFEF